MEFFEVNPTSACTGGYPILDIEEDLAVGDLVWVEVSIEKEEALSAHRGRASLPTIRLVLQSLYLLQRGL